MTRLIDADALLEALKDNGTIYKGDFNNNEFIYFSDALDLITNAPTVQREGWVSVEDRLPELKDDSVLACFENGSIETVHIEDYFKQITNGFDAEGNQVYTKWYLHHDPKVTHWQPLPAAPTNKE